MPPSRNPYRLYQQALQLEHRHSPEVAEAEFQNLAVQYPSYPWVHEALAQFYERQARLPEAYQTYLQAQNVSPQEHFEIALATLEVKMGQANEALQRCLPLLTEGPYQAQAISLLVQSLLLPGAWPSFYPFYLALQHQNPQIAGKLAFGLAHCYEQQARFEEAESLYMQAVTCQPQRWDWHLRQQLFFPVIAPARAQIGDWHQRMKKALQECLRQGSTLTPLVSVGDFLSNLLPLNNLAYHDHHLRPLRQLFGQLASMVLPVYAQALPQRSSPPYHLGLFFAETSIGACRWCYQALLNVIDAELFTITVFSTTPRVTTLFGPAGITHPRAKWQVVSSNFEQAAQQVRQATVDIMLFTEPSYNQLQYYLACCRVAPRQCTSILNPGTSGLSQIDYFLSSELAETATDQDHYSESLIRLATPPLFMLRQTRSEPLMSRTDFGLPQSGPMLICPQNPFKFHPDFDVTLGRILQQLPHAFLVLVTVKAFEPFRDRLLQRLRQTIPTVMARIWVLPQLTPDEFLHMLTLADVMLDTFHSGGGATTSYGFGMGVPIVTWPSRENVHGRITAMVYRRMGITDCIAADPESYSNLAVRLAEDQVFNHDMRRRIAAQVNIVFDSPDTARVLEDFFTASLKETPSWT